MGQQVCFILSVLTCAHTLFSRGNFWKAGSVHAGPPRPASCRSSPPPSGLTSLIPCGLSAIAVSSVVPVVPTSVCPTFFCQSYLCTVFCHLFCWKRSLMYRHTNDAVMTRDEGFTLQTFRGNSSGPQCQAFRHHNNDTGGGKDRFCYRSHLTCKGKSLILTLRKP